MNTRELKQNFLHSYGRYHGPFTPEQLAFNANLQEFANQVNIISALETNGKLSAEDAYQRILWLWKKLSESRDNLLSRKSAN